jgi:hypothetical protein
MIYRSNPYYPLRYSRRKIKERIALRPITLEEAKRLDYGDELWMLDRYGEAVRVRVVSKVKRWKRDPDRVEFSVKYGLYETIRVTTDDILRGEVLVEDDVLPGMEII